MQAPPLREKKPNPSVGGTKSKKRRVSNPKKSGKQTPEPSTNSWSQGASREGPNKTETKLARKPPELKKKTKWNWRKGMWRKKGVFWKPSPPEEKK